MSKNGRKPLNAGLFSEQEGIFRCPVCSSPMKMVDFKSLICSNRHCFDLAKQGYVNLLPASLKTKYDKQMFESRKIIYQSGFFEPLLEKISERIINELHSQSEPAKILDAGCGEGSHLSSIQETIKSKTANDILSVGVDISKDGIYMAAKAYPHSIWCVADLSKFPFAGKQFNFILNILAPANYSEFQRILTDEGMVIKVIPESAYLQELRAIFYKETNRQVYANDNTLDLFKKNLFLLDVQRVKYVVTLDSSLVDPLLRMTPLLWGTTGEGLLNTQEMNLREVTIDLTILVGKK